MQQIRLSDFLRLAEEMASEWREVISAVNNLSIIGVRQADLNKAVFGRTPEYERFKTGEHQEEWGRVFIPSLCDSVRMASAIQVLRQHYIVIPDE